MMKPQICADQSFTFCYISLLFIHAKAFYIVTEPSETVSIILVLRRFEGQDFSKICLIYIT